jgi:eukaryotic-like serine/threonine-protein kinase
VAETLVRRFEREAQATASLHSPHTIELYDFGIARDGTFYYVMELLDGIDLDGLVRRFGPLPAERVVHLLLQACDSLANAHGIGLVHRDIKPANIYLCSLGMLYDFVKVLDFGLVKAAWTEGEDEGRLTQDGTVAGTPAYMAPEVLLGESVDGRADLYALGCVAYWLLTGHTVFAGANATQMAMDHAKTPPVPLSQRTSSPVPDALDRIVLRCLEKDPARRPASAEELASGLAKTGLQTAWTPDRARAWWEEHLRERVKPRVDEPIATWTKSPRL